MSDGRAEQRAREADRDRWHTQTILGGGDVPPEQRGDCVRACITSILGLPVDAIENIHGDQWWDRLQAEVARYDYALSILDVRMEPPRCYWIASLPSLVLGPEPDGSRALHCVIARGYELVHDPGMVKPGYTAETWANAWNDDKIEEGWALVPLDPCAAEREAVTLRQALEALEAVARPIAEGADVHTDTWYPDLAAACDAARDALRGSAAGKEQE